MFAAFFLLLAAAAWPAIQHHVAALPGDPAISALERGRALTEAGLWRAMESRREALVALENNRARRELGLAHLRRARDPEVDLDIRLDDVAAAETALRVALGRSPADHFAWYHLAMAEALAEKGANAAGALANAYHYGPYHPPIHRARVRLGLALWADLEPPTRERVVADLARMPTSRR